MKLWFVGLLAALTMSLTGCITNALKLAEDEVRAREMWLLRQEQQMQEAQIESVPRQEVQRQLVELERARAALLEEQNTFMRRQAQLMAELDARLAAQPPSAGPVTAGSGSTRSYRPALPSLDKDRPAGSEKLSMSAGSKDATSRLAELSRNVEELKRLQAAPGSTAASTPPAAASGPELRPGAIAWNTPPKMAMNETAVVELVVTRDQHLVPTVANQIKAPGKTVTETGEFSKIVVAKLESTAFEISPPGPIEQTVLDGRFALWKWDIRPKFKGKHWLLLTVTSKVEGSASIKPEVREIEVTAGADDAEDAARAFLTSNWKEILTVVLIPVGAGAWRLYRRKTATGFTPLPPLPPTDT